MVNRQRTAGNSGAAGVSVIAGHDQLIATKLLILGLAGHVVIQRALAQRKRCAFCNRHIASAGARRRLWRPECRRDNFQCVAVVVAGAVYDQRAPSPCLVSLPPPQSEVAVVSSSSLVTVKVLFINGVLRAARAEFCARVPTRP